MFVVGNLLLALAGVVHAVAQFVWWVLVARIVLSWLRPAPQNDILRQIVRAIYALTDPVFDRVRRLLPFLVVGGLDLTPIALFLALGALDSFVPATLVGIAHRMS